MKYKGEVVSLFSKIPTLSSIEIPAKRLLRIFEINDKRYPEAMLQKLISLNKKTFDFIGITPSIIQRNYQFILSITTSNYIGAAPLISPKNGKQICSINVIGRYGEEIGELLSLMSDRVQPEYSPTLKLPESQEKPPIYLECCRYIDTYLEAIKYKWNKFTNEVKVQPTPSPGTQWTRYAQNFATSPLNFLIFHNKCNILSTDHTEWRQLSYVLSICIKVLESSKTPIRVRSTYHEKVIYLKRALAEIGVEPVNSFAPRMADPFVIKRLKGIGNTILDGNSDESIAWRVDYSNFFEKYVQYIISDVARKAGACIHNNQHLPNRADNRPKWGLAYLEPDIILQKNDVQYIVDAKYKSHIYNWNDHSETLKDDFRKDLHQVLAYSSFSKNEHKNVILIYPFIDFSEHRMKITSPLNSCCANVQLIGIPIAKNTLEETIDRLRKAFRFEHED